MATPTRTETMIALRARREAFQVASDVAYQKMELPPRVEPMQWCGFAEPVYEPPLLYAYGGEVEYPPEPAPWWMKWFSLGCMMIILAALCLIPLTR